MPVKPASDTHIDATPEAGSRGPVPDNQRLESLDVLRGVGVLGILVMNVYAFAMPFMAYGNPLVMGGVEPINIGTWFFTHIFVDQKFMSIFSMLFGAGVLLMSERAAAPGAAVTPVFLRRQFWLLVIGLVHAYLIWFGDILTAYALIAPVVYLFRHASPRTLVLSACLVLPVALLLSYAGAISLTDLEVRAEDISSRQAAGESIGEDERATLDAWADARRIVLPGADELEADLAAHGGSYADVLRYRAPVALWLQLEGLPFYVLWRAGGLMLLGMAMMKLGILGAEKTTGFYVGLMAGGYLAGLPLTVFSAVNAHAHAFDAIYMLKIGGIFNYVGSVFVALGHVGLVLLLVKRKALPRLTARFAAVGRMALTNYLMHSIVMTSLFYGYGLDLYGQIPRAGQMVFVAGLIGLQLMISPWWLARFRFGPVEWLWRSLTYWRPQPMRRFA